MPGQFGENFTVEGLADDAVCVGDRYRIGDALFEVIQPRVTCFKVGNRMGEPRMPALLVAEGRPGFYLRVLGEGQVEAGDAIEKVASGPERMTVRALSELPYMPGHGRAELRRAPAPLDTPASGYVLICCSRPTGEVTLDLWIDRSPSVRWTPCPPPPPLLSRPRPRRGEPLTVGAPVRRIDLRPSNSPE